MIVAQNSLTIMDVVLFAIYKPPSYTCSMYSHFLSVQVQPQP